MQLGHATSGGAFPISKYCSYEREHGGHAYSYRAIIFSDLSCGKISVLCRSEVLYPSEQQSPDEPREETAAVYRYDMALEHELQF